MPSPTFEYRSARGDAVGPLGEEEVRGALASGAVSPLTMARSSADPVWRPLREVLGLEAPDPAPTPDPWPVRRRRADPPAAGGGSGAGAGATLEAVAFVDLDPILRLKRRLLVVPATIEAIWCVALLLGIPSLAFTLVFSALAGAALWLGDGGEAASAAVLLGTAFVLFCAAALLWLSPFALFAAVKRDARWAIVVMTAVGVAAGAGLVGRDPTFPPSLPAGVLMLASAVVAANGLAHLAALARLRRDGAWRDLVRDPDRGASPAPGPGLAARIGAGFDLVRATVPVALIGCVVVLATEVAGPFALLVFLCAWTVARRRASRLVLDAVATARERLQAAADRRFPADAPAPILFLRSFSDDVIRTEAFGMRAMSAVFGVDLESRRLEESLVAAVRRAGPVIAIARPGHGRAAIGAARQRLADDAWQAAVSGHVARAACIVLVQGKTEGLGWELGEIRRQGAMGRLILVVPPNRGAGMEEVVRAWIGQPEADVPKAFVGAAPPLAAIAGASAAAVEVCIASRRDAEAYRLAARFCLNRILGREGRA